MVGLGTIGRDTLRRVLTGGAFDLVGCADADPAVHGRDAGELCGLGRRGLPVVGGAAEVLASSRPDVVFLTTGSRASEVTPLAVDCLRAGASVVASSEELAEPRLHPAETGRLGAAAELGQARFVATGVNPGFALDYLPAVLATASTAIARIEARRVVDSLTRRPQLRKKTGAGLEAGDFAKQVGGHVGLKESAALVARTLGREVAIGETIEPVIAAAEVATPEGTIRRGRVRGIRQVASAVSGDREIVRLELVIAAGQAGIGDWIRIEGDPPISVEIQGGVQGEAATVARMLASARPLLGLAPGVYTVLDLAPVAAERVWVR